MNLNLGDTQLLITEAKKQGLLRNQLAYVLATVYHETTHTMKPIEEMGGLTYLKSKKYYPFFGRGYVQITWEENYVKAGKKLGVDFVKFPDLLLDPKYAVPICITGMIEGWFAGDSKGRQTLARYMTLSMSDFEGARRIINGTDQKSLIAGYAKTYDDLLKTSEYGLTDTQKPVVVDTTLTTHTGGLQTIPEVPVIQPPLDHVPVVKPPVASTGPSGILGLIIMIITAIFGRKK